MGDGDAPRGEAGNSSTTGSGKAWEFSHALLNVKLPSKELFRTPDLYYLVITRQLGADHSKCMSLEPAVESLLA